MGAWGSPEKNNDAVTAASDIPTLNAVLLLLLLSLLLLLLLSNEKSRP